MNPLAGAGKDIDDLCSVESWHGKGLYIDRLRVKRPHKLIKEPFSAAKMTRTKGVE